MVVSLRCKFAPACLPVALAGRGGDCDGDDSISAGDFDFGDRNRYRLSPSTF